MNSLIGILFDVGNVIFFIGLILLIKEVIRNRNILRGFSLVGSLLTIAALIPIVIAQYLLWNLVSVFCIAISILFWSLVSIYLIRIKVPKK